VVEPRPRPWPHPRDARAIIPAVVPLLEHRLIVVTGKGGVGKTTIAGALGMLAARRGLRTIIVEVGEHRRLPGLFGQPQDGPIGAPVELSEHLESLTIDPDRVLADWLRSIGGRVSARVLTSSTTFQYFVAAVPGAREMLSLIEVSDLLRARRGRRAHDLAILDAPATGHALAMLKAPKTFAAIARVGPIAGQARAVSELLEDPARTAYLAVAQGTEMAVSETLELQEGLRGELGVELHAVVVNATLPRRFQNAELEQLQALEGRGGAFGSAALAARSVHDRARFQRNQIERLRRRELSVLGVPFQFRPGLDLAALGRIADHLERRLGET
jgi:anion-transporting  ArsA/GET3 family ATPase